MPAWIDPMIMGNAEKALKSLQMKGTFVSKNDVYSTYTADQMQPTNPIHSDLAHEKEDQTRPTRYVPE
jgi:hypothetical protein